MKRSFTTSLFAMMTAAVLLSACKKENNVPVEFTYVSLTNVSPSTATYNVSFDGARFVSGALPFEGNVAYKQVNPKTYSVKLTTESSSDSKLTKDLTFANNKGYSLFIIGKTDQLDFLQLEDELKTPSTDKALIRFINLSPDAPVLNLKEKDKETIISDKAYKTASSFIEVEARKYIFDLVDKATGLPKGTMAEVELKKGLIYTIIAKGLLSPAETEKPFGGLVLIN